jgi:hypothetical protein
MVLASSEDNEHPKGINIGGDLNKVEEFKKTH